ncbi:hypothetical protein G3578_07560 [Brevibacillus sp. SYP-B805]|uniref:hypothetical protein n=1 Tax=Brevibacillus sp. SYP-B805 TaxID=1578199 RepID=UPI0013E99E98|nr:hypothetical protein [Brevibacillus sp. SYP-B805]NGQ95041.1 hypothetical protein [Brevibacillus sp. SYP-B805]
MQARQLQVVDNQQPVTIEYVPSVAVTLEQAAANLKKLDAIRTQIMRSGVDYDTIPGTPKPTLLKPGAERLLQFYGLGHRIHCVHKTEDWENGFFYYVYRVTIVKTYPTHEIVVAECEGSANSKEKRYKNQDVYSIVNTLQKMAIKRALVGATLQATGTSGFFTQDIEDMDLGGSLDAARRAGEERLRQERQKEQQRSIGSKMTGASSEAQQKAIRTVASKKGLSDDELKAIIKSIHGVDSVSELDKQAASEMITLLQEMSADELKQLALANQTSVETAQMTDDDIFNDIE